MNPQNGDVLKNPEIGVIGSDSVYEYLMQMTEIHKYPVCN